MNDATQAPSVTTQDGEDSAVLDELGRLTPEAYERAQRAIDGEQHAHFQRGWSENEVNANGPDGGWTVLMYAAMVDRHAIVALLLSALAADPNVTNDHDDTALIIAARHGAATSLSLLLAAGADIRARNRDSRDALTQAICYRQRRCFELLLPLYTAPRFSLDERDRDSLAPLHHAVTYGNAEAARALLRAGADAGALDGSGYSLLHHAVLEGYPDLVELLLAAKGDWAPAMPDGRDVRDVAPTKRIRKLLRRALADE